VLEVPRTDFLPGAGGTEPFHQRLVVRETATMSPTGWPLLPKVAHRAHPAVEVAQGNHSVVGPWTKVVPVGGLVEILHFPMRDYAQFERKVVNTGEAFARTPSVPSDVAMDQRELYALHAEGRLRDYFEERLAAEEAIEAGLTDGTLVVDRRLADFMANGSRPVRGARPDAQAARMVTAATLGLAAADARRAAAEDRLATVEADLARARDDIAELDRRLTETREALRSESAALAALRASRLVRWTQTPRRLYYRVQDRIRGQGSPSSQS
jgi:hypothetical protein